MENIFTTTAIKANKRAEFWEQFVCKFITDVDCEITTPDRFHGEIRSYMLGRIVISRLQAAPHKVGRTHDRIKSNINAPFIVIYQKSGIANYSQCEHVACLQPEDFILYDPRQPYYMELPEPFEQILFQFPRNTLKPLTGRLSDIIGCPIAGNAPGKDLCASLINSFDKHIHDFAPITMHGFAETIVNLIVQVFDSELCHHNQKKHVGNIGGSTIARAKQYIIGNIQRNHLSLKTIAEHTGVSARHLSRLFQAEGSSSVAKWIKTARLERCASTLVNPYYSGNTVAEIAYESGFNDISHFCRDFKKVYKSTPSEYRNFHFGG